MAHVVVEQSFDAPLTDAGNAALDDPVKPCLSEHGVVWFVSYFASDRRRKICHFDAADAEAVRTAFRSAGTRLDRAWTAEMIGGAAP